MTDRVSSHLRDTRLEVGVVQRVSHDPARQRPGGLTVFDEHLSVDYGALDSLGQLADSPPTRREKEASTMSQFRSKAHITESAPLNMRLLNGTSWLWDDGIPLGSEGVPGFSGFPRHTRMINSATLIVPRSGGQPQIPLGVLPHEPFHGGLAQFFPPADNRVRVVGEEGLGVRVIGLVHERVIAHLTVP